MLELIVNYCRRAPVFLIGKNERIGNKVPLFKKKRREKKDISNKVHLHRPFVDDRVKTLRAHIIIIHTAAMHVCATSVLL